MKSPVFPHPPADQRPAFAHTSYEGRLESGGVDIISLPVSDAWKKKFSLLEKAGGVKLTKMKQLAFGERYTLNFNFLAFFFGPFYYASKGMWRKALVFTGLAIVAIVVLSIALEMAGLDRFAKALGYGVAALFATRANIDYYKKMVLKQNGWW
jgi:hypothetical protein